MLDEDLIQTAFGALELPEVDRDLLGGPLHAGQGLVDHDSGVG